MSVTNAVYTVRKLLVREFLPVFASFLQLKIEKYKKNNTHLFQFENI